MNARLLDRRLALAAIAALACAAGGCIFQVKIDSVPQGAEVLVNDTSVGNTPLVLLFNADNRTVSSIVNDGADQRKFDRKTTRDWWGEATVTVRMTGYETIVRNLSFGGDAVHTFELVRLAGRGGPGPGATAPPGPAMTAAAPSPTVTGVAEEAQAPVEVITGIPAPEPQAPGRTQPHRRGTWRAPAADGGRAGPRVIVGTPVDSGYAQGTIVTPSAAEAAPAGHAPAGLAKGAAGTGAEIVSIAGGLDQPAAAAEAPWKPIPMGSLGFSFFSIDPLRATSLDHILLGAEFAIPIPVGDDMAIDLLLDMGFANVVVRRNGRSLSTDTILGFAFGAGLKTLLPRKLIPVDIGKEAWLRFGAAFEVPFIYSMMKGDFTAFGYSDEEGVPLPTTVDYIFYGARLSLFTELHGKTELSKALVPHFGFAFDIMWQGTINGINFTRDGFPMLMLLGAKANIGKHTFFALDLNMWLDQIELALSLESKI